MAPLLSHHTRTPASVVRLPEATLPGHGSWEAAPMTILPDMVGHSRRHLGTPDPELGTGQPHNEILTKKPHDDRHNRQGGGGDDDRRTNLASRGQGAGAQALLHREGMPQRAREQTDYPQYLLRGVSARNQRAYKAQSEGHRTVWPSKAFPYLGMFQPTVAGRPSL